jgi:hypothetical protein
LSCRDPKREPAGQVEDEAEEGSPLSELEEEVESESVALVLELLAIAPSS